MQNISKALSWLQELVERNVPQLPQEETDHFIDRYKAILDLEGEDEAVGEEMLDYLKVFDITGQEQTLIILHELDTLTDKFEMLTGLDARRCALLSLVRMEQWMRVLQILVWNQKEDVEGEDNGSSEGDTDDLAVEEDKPNEQ